jgi:hypothetical protein
MTAIKAFCVSGGHASNIICGSTEEGATTPGEWKLVRASIVDGQWVRDEDSAAQILCCPEHVPPAAALPHEWAPRPGWSTYLCTYCLAVTPDPATFTSPCK